MNNIEIEAYELRYMFSDLMDKIRASGDYFTKVIGIERGGLNISVPIAKCLGVPHDSIKVSFYHSDEPVYDEEDIKKKIFGWGVPVLLVDDLIDSGKTAKLICDVCPKSQWGREFKMATLHWNPECEIEPHFWAKEKPKDSWIVYPWENIKGEINELV